ncbi:hypothetical protein Tco_0790895 [Tanacetum coccineum]
MWTKARLEDIEVEIDTLRADTEDKELLISKLQDSLAAAENEIAFIADKGCHLDKEYERILINMFLMVSSSIQDDDMDLNRLRVVLRDS